MSDYLVSEMPFEALKSFVLDLGQRIGENPTHEELDSVASELRDLALKIRWDTERFPTAVAGEFLMRDIVISTGEGASLYLVSESPGVIDPPHEHCTWTIVVGIRGHQLNTMYTIVDESKRFARKASSLVVGPGDAIVMDADAIHSISVVEGVSTFHLHMYGSPISSRRAFSLRCYQDIDYL